MKKIRFAVVMILTLSMLMGMSITSFAATSMTTTKGVTAWKESSSVDDYGEMYLIVLVSNGNSSDAIVSMNAISLNSSGKKMESSSSDIICMNSGEDYALIATFPKSAKATNYDYDLIVDNKLTGYDVQSASEFIDAKFSDDGNGNVKIYATNTSAYTIEGEAIAVFFDGDEIADFGRVVLSNSEDFVLSPGEMTTETVSTDHYYTSSTIYVTGVR